MKTQIKLIIVSMFLQLTNPLFAQEIIDQSHLLVNPKFANGIEGWDASVSNYEGSTWEWTPETTTQPCVVEAYAGYSGFEAYAFSLTQKVSLTAGHYRLKAPAFYRWGSSYSSDLNNADGLGPRSMAYLVAGNNQLKVYRLGDIDKSHLRPFDYANTMKEAAAAFAAGLYVNTLYFEVEKDTVLTIGFQGTNDRGQSWFIAGPLTLEKVQTDTQEKEISAELEAYKSLYPSLKEKFIQISQQHESTATFDYMNADEAYQQAETIDQIEDAIRMLSNALSDYMTQTIGRFDLTSLIDNPGFESGEMGKWSSLTHGDNGVRADSIELYTMLGTEGDYLFNTYADSKTASYNYFLLQTLPYMPAGLYQMTAQLASTESGSTLALVAGTSSENVSCSEEKVAKEGTLTFRLKENTDLRIGATSNRWFKADDFKLYFMNESFLLREPLLAKLDVYEQIVMQATDRTDYDKKINEVKLFMDQLQTSAQVDSLKDVAFAAFVDLLENVPAKNGQYDLTYLIYNPHFSNGHISWNPSGTSTFSYDIGESFNNTGTFTIKQTLSKMPAGWYTVTAKAFSRPTDFVSTLSTYLTGTPKVKASLTLDSKKVNVYNILDDPRFATTSTGFEYYGLPDGASVPNTMNKANQIFGFGHYNNILRYQKTTAGNLSFGISQSAASENNWLAFDDFHLYYGKTKEVDMDTLQYLTKTYANVKSSRILKAGVLEPICLPYTPDMSSFAAVYELASIDKQQVVLFPAREMKAGKVYFVKVNSDTPLEAKDVEMTSVIPDSIPAYWNGAFQKGEYAKGIAKNAHILNAEGTALVYVEASEVPAATPRFYLPLSMDAGDITIPVTIHEDWMNMNFKPHIENFRVEEFISNNTYDRTSVSVVANYNVAPTWRRDQPRSVTIPIPTLESKPRKMVVNYSENKDMSDSISVKTGRESKVWHIYNLIPGRTYYYEVVADDAVITKGEFTTQGRVRMLRFNSGSNMRDLGGWTTADGRTVRYGKVYRGGELHKGLETTMNNYDLADFIAMGITAELDLRNNDQVVNNVSPGVSALGKDIPYVYFNQYMFGDDALQQDTMIYRRAFNFIAENLNDNRIVYFHCIWGADRTGALAMLLNGLLGVTLDQLYKDYELTSFSKAGIRAKEGLDSKLNYLAQYGGTIQQQIYRYLSQYVNVPEANLKAIQKHMLVGEPSAIHDVLQPATMNDTIIYDLQGRIVAHPTRPGIYIRNGKKFIVR